MFTKINTGNWFKANLLSLSFEKTSFMQFLTKNSSNTNINIGYDTQIPNNTYVKFLGIMIDDTLAWKIIIEVITTKLSSAYYAVRAIKPFASQDILNMMYTSYFLLIMKYGIILWGNSTNNKNIFSLQKRVIRIIMGVGTRVSCREFFNILNILPLISQYIFSQILFIVINNNHLFKIKYEVHNINTKNKLNCYQPSSSHQIFTKDLIIWKLSYIMDFLPK